MNYDTIKLIGLQPHEVEKTDIYRKNDVIYFVVTLSKRDYFCPICGSTHINIKDYKVRDIIHSILNMNKTIIQYRCRRLVCKDCGKTFIEDNPFTDKNEKISNATVLQVLKDCRRLNYTFASIAEKNNISASSVTNIFDQYIDISPGHLPRVLSIDEFYLGRTWKNKFACVFVDWERNKIIDIFPSRKKYDLHSFMQYINKKEFDNVHYVSIDMNTTYRDLAIHFFKKSTIMVDSFHVVKNINEALKNLRIHIMYKQDKDSVEYYLLKHWNYLLMKRKGDIENNEPRYNKKIGYSLNKIQILDLILDIDPALKEAYKWKEDYLDFNEDYTYETAPKRYDELYDKLLVLNRNEFKDVVSCLKNWRTEILNSFILINGRRISNGPIESINGRIKTLLRVALKYKNFERLRNRIMYCLNKDALPNITGKKRTHRVPKAPK